MDFKKIKVLVLARKKAVSVINVKNRGGITYNILVRAANLAKDLFGKKSFFIRYQPPISGHNNAGFRAVWDVESQF